MVPDALLLSPWHIHFVREGLASLFQTSVNKIMDFIWNEQSRVVILILIVLEITRNPV